MLRYVIPMLLLSGGAQAARTITVGSLTLTHCVAEYDAYCGSITRPLDRSGVLPGNVTVGFEFYPHTDTTRPSAGTIMAQEGGPGYSSTGSRDGYVRMLAPLRTTRDFLIIDKRGTGRSSPIDCPALQRAYLPSQSDIAACAAQLGTSAWYYRSADAADDFAAVLAALQITQTDYYGDSYATWFGEVFAVLHPGLLRTMVLDSAYPVLGDNFDSEITHGQEAMQTVCERSPSCRRLPTTATGRFALLLDSLRARKVQGTAPGANGEPRQVTADPAGLLLIIANAGNTPTTWRDLDSAGRAWLTEGDALPLLRLVAEARDSYSGGGPSQDFSVGLATAVQCAEYGTPYDLYSPVAKRQKQYPATLARWRADRPETYAPFTINDVAFAQMDAEVFDLCLTWPAPPHGVVPAQPIPPQASFPSIPVLVLSGELDTITSPHEGRATAKLFPDAKFIETTNLIHESAIGDGGVFVPPNGEDLSACIGPIVRQFIASGGEAGDTGCVAHIRPIRTVPAFHADYTRTEPAAAAAGNAVSAAGLVLASAVAETVGDAVARYYITTSGHEAGLRGGGFDLSSTDTGYVLDLKDAQWATGLAVSGRVTWNQLTGAIAAEVSFSAPGHSGNMSISWNDRQTDAVAGLAGTIDGATLAATRIAP
jgi:pimeloyl-ACP methyl ester carboxylesterase